MKTPLFYLFQTAQTQDFYQSIFTLSKSLNQEFKNTAPQRILLTSPNPITFLSYFIAIASSHHQLFLGNPHWKKSEWQQVFDWVQPHQIIDDYPNINHRHNNTKLSFTQDPLIMIPTGGTSGKIRFVMHNWETLTASAKGFINYFQIEQVNSFCILPLYHVSGLMQFVRSLLTGGQFIVTSYAEIKAEKWCHFNSQDYFISLVPTQLQQLLTNPKLTQWLSQFKTILLGGAPAWNNLLQQARKAKLPLSPTYGMTETASQIVTLKPQDFLSGMNNSGKVLPHAKIEINKQGIIQIQGKSLALGYYPDYFNLSEGFLTDDLGYLDEAGYLTILGRKSQKIISGGENIFPSEVESVIRQTQLVKDVVIVGVSDDYWGEKVVAVYVPIDPNITVEQIEKAIVNQLAKYKQPKKWIRMDKLPRNAQGKVNYSILKEMIMTYANPDNKH